MNFPPSSMWRALGAVIVVTATGWAMNLFQPAPAQACGGFFCSQVPIDQSGETIIFGVDKEESKVTATIQINYQGEAKDFAWVIPVMSAPEISLAPQSMFGSVGTQTEPRFSLNWDMDGGSCWWDYAFENSAVPAAGGGGGVEVVDSQEVGPYDTVTLDSDDAEALHAWLDEHEFDQPDSAIPLIQHYLDQGMLFVAMKLKQDATAGDIQPVTLAMDEDAPCVPLVLTQVAATPDMPVLVYVLGDMRAIPTNWFHVELNQKKIDWINGGSNYDELVTLAIDEAAGHGFVTEFAGSADFLEKSLWWEGRFDLDALLTKTQPEAFLMELLQQGFPRDAQMQGLIQKHIPKPAAEDLPEDCQTDQQFYTWNLEMCLAYMEEGWVFNPVAFVADLEERVVAALKEAQKIFDAYPYVTRMYTTVSPDEMTRDPFFAFNPELEDVSNIHTASATGTCNDETGEITDVVITLENGETVSIEGPVVWTWDAEGDYAGAVDEPAAAKIELLSETGAGEEVPRTRAGEVDQRLDEENPSMVASDLEAGVYASSGGGSGGGAGCQGGTTPPFGMALLALLALAVIRRR